MKNYFKTVKINSSSMVPKYRQLANAIVHGISSGRLIKEEGLPSIHEISTALEISKNTVEKAYNLLKGYGIVGSFKGKGHYVVSDTNKMEYT